MRQPIGLSLRFKILQRDHFLCQYCGRRPPDVELQVDHIHPVFLGGDNHPDNLITSCRDCNSGKRAKTLENHPRAGVVGGGKFRAHPREAEILLAIEDAYWKTIDKHLSDESWHVFDADYDMAYQDPGLYEYHGMHEEDGGA